MNPMSWYCYNLKLIFSKIYVYHISTSPFLFSVTLVFALDAVMGPVLLIVVDEVAACTTGLPSRAIMDFFWEFPAANGLRTPSVCIVSSFDKLATAALDMVIFGILCKSMSVLLFLAGDSLRTPAYWSTEVSLISSSSTLSSGSIDVEVAGRLMALFPPSRLNTELDWKPRNLFC